MVFRIFFLCFLFLVLSLILLFLFYILFPAISKQTGITDDTIFSNIEKNYVIPKEEEVKISKSRALVMCSPNKKFRKIPIRFNKKQSCALINSVYVSGNDCKFSCIGLGDCVKACPQQAIYIKNMTAVVSNLCIGCGKCIDICPKHIIKLIPEDTKNSIICNNLDYTLTSCTALRKDQQIERTFKKGFKIWSYCYNIIKHFIN